MTIRNLILDWSGTLVDDLTPVWKTTNYVFAAFGLPPLSLATFRHEFCLPVRKFYCDRIPGVTLAELERVFLEEYPKHRHEIQMLPHTLKFLEFCTQSGRQTFIASSVDAGTYAEQMQRFGLDRYITKPYIGVEDKTEKIHHILDENRLDPGQTLFVGDMEHDIEAGKAGGVHTCAMLTGYNHADRLQALQPDLVCQHLGELQAILLERQVPAPVIQLSLGGDIG